MDECIKALKNLGFKKVDNTLVRSRGKYGDEIVDLNALTWYYPSTAKNAEGHWQYSDPTDILNDVKMYYGHSLVKHHYEGRNILAAKSVTQSQILPG